MPNLIDCRTLLAALACTLTACQPVNINVGEVRGVDARGASVGDVNANANVNASINAQATVNANANVNTSSGGSQAAGGESPSPAPSAVSEPYPAGHQAKLKVVAGTGKVGALDGEATSATFSSPGGLAFERDGHLLIADTGNHMVRRLSPDGKVSTLIKTPEVQSVQGVAVNSAGQVLVGDPAQRRISRKVGEKPVEVFVDGSHRIDGVDDPNLIFPIVPTQLYVDHRDSVYAVAGEGRLLPFSPSGATLSSPLVSLGGVVALTDGTLVGTVVNEHRLVKLSGYTSSQFVGSSRTFKPGSDDGRGEFALFNRPTLMTRDAKDTMYVYDSGNASIRKVTAGGDVTTLYKADKADSLGEIGGMTVDAKGMLYLTDKTHHRVMRVD